MNRLRRHKWTLIGLGIAFYTVAAALPLPEDLVSPGARHGVWSHRILGIVRGL